jgi:nicotinamidase-related amidase
MNLSPLDLKQTALVLIDLQRGIINLPTQPRAGVEVIQNAAKLVARFRQAKATVVLVRVTPSPDGLDALKPEADQSIKRGPLPPDWAEWTSEISLQTNDIVITKRQWGAFYGTELDLQLRRRGVNRIVLGGIATHIGVESTARVAFELGYQQIFVEDAMASLSAETHAYAISKIFPLIGQVRSTEDVLAACAVSDQ